MGGGDCAGDVSKARGEDEADEIGAAHGLSDCLGDVVLFAEAADVVTDDALLLE